MVGLVALVTAGAAATLAAGLPSRGLSVPAPRNGAANERAARADARRLLSKLMLPAGATISGSDPSRGRLSGPGFLQASIALLDLHRFWRVPEDPNAVTAWVRSHPPAGGSPLGGSENGGPGYRIQTPAYSFPPVGNVLLSRTLAVSITVARGGGTAIRADAEVEWLIPRRVLAVRTASWHWRQKQEPATPSRRTPAAWEHRAAGGSRPASAIDRRSRSGRSHRRRGSPPARHAKPKRSRVR